MLQYIFNTEGNLGNKPLLGTGQDRLFAFSKWATQDRSEEYVVVAGHSLWFRQVRPPESALSLPVLCLSLSLSVLSGAPSLSSEEKRG